jgi:hypothetical protein
MLDALPASGPCRNCLIAVYRAIPDREVMGADVVRGVVLPGRKCPRRLLDRRRDFSHSLQIAAVVDLSSAMAKGSSLAVLLASVII